MFPGAELFKGFGQSMPAPAVQGPPNPTLGSRAFDVLGKFSDKVSGDPALLQALLQFGAQASQPIQPGESGTANLLGALAGSVGSLQSLRANRDKIKKGDDFRTRELDIRQSAVDATKSNAASRVKLAGAKQSLASKKDKQKSEVAAQKWEENAILKLNESFVGTDTEKSAAIEEIKAARTRIFGDSTVTPPTPTLSVSDILTAIVGANPQLRPGDSDFQEALSLAQSKDPTITAADLEQALPAAEPAQAVSDTVSQVGTAVLADIAPELPDLNAIPISEIAANAGALRHLMQTLQQQVEALGKEESTPRPSGLIGVRPPTDANLTQIGKLRTTQLHIKRTLERANLSLGQ